MSGELKVGVSDAFAHGRFVVGDTDVLGRVVWGGGVDGIGSIEGVAEEEGDALFVGPYVSGPISVGEGGVDGSLTG